MIFSTERTSRADVIETPETKHRGVQLLLLREDLLHPEISGNKWRKMQHNLAHVATQDYRRVLTFGGAHSNHVAAFAAAAKVYDFEATVVIRGEELQDTPTIRQAKAYGATVHLVSRATYAAMKSGSSPLPSQVADAFVIPEGGGNFYGILGCKDIVLCHPELFDSFWCVACGTGTTMSGMALANTGGGHREVILGFSAVKNFDMKAAVEQHLAAFVTTEINECRYFDGYALGGFASFEPEVVQFILDFKAQTGIQLDPVYTGKMMFGVFDLIRQGYFPKGSRIVAVHTGGLQGIEAFNRRYGTQLALF